VKAASSESDLLEAFSACAAQPLGLGVFEVLAGLLVFGVLDGLLVFGVLDLLKPEVGTYP